MSLPPLHAIDHAELRAFLHGKAARYYADYTFQHRLVERTISAITNDTSVLDDGDVEHRISRVLHRLAVAELRSLNALTHAIAGAIDATVPVLSLTGQRCLVVEDEYFAAADLLSLLESAGATVLGPVSHIQRAMEVLAEPDIALDVAILDINLNGEMVYPAAALLAERGTPFVFVTGYSTLTMPHEFADAPCLMKPCNNAALLKVLSSVVSHRGAQDTPRLL